MENQQFLFGMDSLSVSFGPLSVSFSSWSLLCATLGKFFEHKCLPGMIFEASAFCGDPQAPLEAQEDLL